MKKVIINPQYEYLRTFIENIPYVFDKEGHEIYHQRNCVKIFTAANGTILNVKRYKIPHFLNRIIYSSGIRKPKGQRAWEYPQILRSKGINTHEPVAYIEMRQMGILGDSYFISIQCDYGHTLYEIGDAPASVYEPMAVALAYYAAHIHENKIMHKDFTPGNILWKKDKNGNYCFSLVDINRMYFGEVDIQKGIKNLTRLWGPKRFIQLLVRKYASIRHFNEDAAEMLAMAERTRFWKKYQKKYEIPFQLEL